MPTLSEKEFLILKNLSEIYYEVVPIKYKTFCSLTSEVSKFVLKYFQIESQLLPCQAWLSSSKRDFIIGFTNSNLPKKWDGHVVCLAKNWLIDAATHHFKKDFGIDVPDILLSKKFQFESNVIARVEFDSSSSIWWFKPPHESKILIPSNPEELIMQLSNTLIDKLEATMRTSF